MRIVSLIPSATEVVCALGLGDCLVGVSHDCDYPEPVKSLPKVTGSLVPADAESLTIDSEVRRRLKAGDSLYTLDREALERLRPDLIVTQALCDVCAVAEVEVLAAADSLPGNPQVVNLEPTTLEEMFVAIGKVAQAAAVEIAGEELVAGLRARVHDVATRTAQIRRRPRVAFLEWLDPPFCSGHWIPELVDLAGGVEGLGRAGHASRTLTWDEVTAWNPEVLFIACCGFDVDRTLEDVRALGSVPGWRELPAVRSGRVFVADGSHYFNRPGPRLVDSLEILAHALHPKVHPLPAPLRAAVRNVGSMVGPAARASI